MSDGMMPDGTMPGGSAGDALNTIIAAGRVPQQVSRAPQGVKPTSPLPDIQPLDASYVGTAALVQFVMTPSLLQLGNINARPGGPYFFAGLINRSIVSQRQIGWSVPPLNSNGWTLQPVDNFSGKVPQGVTQLGGLPTATVSADQAV